MLKHATSDVGDRVTWKWIKGATTTLDDLGNPLASTGYFACLYDGASARLMALRIPAGGTCGTRPCWKAKGTKGFTYSNRDGTPDGVRKLSLAAGVAGKAKMALSAKGSDIPLPLLGSFALPLRMQLQGNGLCWEAVFSTPQESSAERFRSLAD
jgi:hypothetical protein